MSSIKDFNSQKHYQRVAQTLLDLFDDYKNPMQGEMPLELVGYARRLKERFFDDLKKPVLIFNSDLTRII